jgi:hypothetical protein
MQPPASSMVLVRDGRTSIRRSGDVVQTLHLSCDPFRLCLVVTRVRFFRTFKQGLRRRQPKCANEPIPVEFWLHHASCIVIHRRFLISEQ